MVAKQNDQAIRQKLLEAGVKNLKAFGYPSVTVDNILIDAVYLVFFRSMLEDNLGKGFDKQINSLIAEIS